MHKHYKYTITTNYNTEITKFGTGHKIVQNGNRKDISICNLDVEVARIPDMAEWKRNEESEPPPSFFVNGDRIAGDD